MSRKLFPFFAVLVLLALVVTACGGGGDTSALQGEIDSLQSDLDAANAKLEEAMAMPADTVTEQVAVTFAGGGDTLAKVQGLGVLNCGVSGGLPGFSVPDADGNMTGFDWDYCRVVAAAALGNADAAEARPSNASERFPILQSGEIDVLIRNTTWTVSRDTSLGFNFAPTTFYDGQGMAVRKDSGIDTLEGLDGGTVCVNAGTTTEKTWLMSSAAAVSATNPLYLLKPLTYAAPMMKAAAMAGQLINLVWLPQSLFWPTPLHTRSLMKPCPKSLSAHWFAMATTTGSILSNGPSTAPFWLKILVLPPPMLMICSAQTIPKFSTCWV